MRILAVEPYFAGSHRQFLVDWMGRSEHDWTLIDLPGRHWKWRMRHAGWTCAGQVNALVDAGRRWDLVLATDMLPLAEWSGLVHPSVACLPRVLYFHENQLTYPDDHAGARDLHFGWTNLISAAAADVVWFNSSYHREVFLQAADELIGRMPDCRPKDLVVRLTENSVVQCPGVAVADRLPATRRSGPLRIGWASRWDHDKGADDFFNAMRQLAGQDIPFELAVAGESFTDVPVAFAQAKDELADRITHWGYFESRSDYLAWLSDLDVLVSTAAQEFFGLSVVEAITHGVQVAVPDRLAYPSVLIDVQGRRLSDLFYDGGVPGLVAYLQRCVNHVAQMPNRPLLDRAVAGMMADRYRMQTRMTQMDAALQAML